MRAAQPQPTCHSPACTVMSLLLIEVPPRPRLAARQDASASVSASASATATASTEWSYVWSVDGKTATRSGRAATALLPKANSVVAVLPSASLSWHRLTLPRAPASRMRAVLDGLLEEALLDDTAALHFALPPQPSTSGTTWVAAMDKAWFAAALNELESTGLVVDRVVPAAAPLANNDEPALGHFSAEPDAGDDAPPWLTLSTADGVCHVQLSGSLSRALVSKLAGPDTPALWTASPAAAAAAERWLGSNVTVQNDAARLMLATDTRWNLRQFDLAARHRGTLALREAWRRFQGPEWRPARWGLAALLVLNVVGLNLWAWDRSAAIAQRRQAMNELLRSTHPQVRAVLDAPLQMQRETETLRAAAGKPGDGDLEVLLAASASAWPEGLPPLQNLRFENARLTLVNAAFTPAQLAPLRERLVALGFDAQLIEGRLTVARASNSAVGRTAPAQQP